MYKLIIICILAIQINQRRNATLVPTPASKNIIKSTKILTETAEGDKSSHHKRRVQVELLVGQVVSPGIALAVVEHPEDGQGWHADQQDGRKRDDQGILAPFARPPLMVVRLVRTTALTAKNKK